MQSQLDYVRAKLQQLKLADLLVVSESSGVPVSTVRKIRYGEVKNPRTNTVQQLYDHFHLLEEQGEGHPAGPPPPDPLPIARSPAARGGRKRLRTRD